jgi:ribosomal subunit interface protein
MGLRVSGKNMDVGDALRKRAQDHFDTVVAKYFDGPYEGHLTLTHDGNGFRADSVIHLDSGAMLQATGEGGDALSAYQFMAETVEARLRRYNRKLKTSRRRSEDDMPALSYVLASPEDEEVDEDYSPPVIAESTSNLSRLSVGEAVMQLDLAGSDVVVFRHAGHGGLNVVYRRSDGNIGWIDPALGAD